MLRGNTPTVSVCDSYGVGLLHPPRTRTSMSPPVSTAPHLQLHLHREPGYHRPHLLPHLRREQGHHLPYLHPHHRPSPQFTIYIIFTTVPNTTTTITTQDHLSELHQYHPPHPRAIWPDKQTEEMLILGKSSMKTQTQNTYSTQRKARIHG